MTVKRIAALGCAPVLGLMVLAGCGTSSGAKASAESSSTPGVTATTIRIGMPYVDLAPVRKQFGLKINQGSWPDAYNALIDAVNAEGGINGRKLVPYVYPVNPSSTAANQVACTAMAEDDHVFAVLGPLSPECYQQKGIISIFGSQAAVTAPGEAPNFTLSPPANAFDPHLLSVFEKKGLFKGKKVGIFAGASTDEAELKVVQSALAADHVDVVQTGVNTAPATDQVASNQQTEVIAERFQSAGVDEVVAVGTGSTVWPEGLQAAQSKYNPPWIATNESDLAGYAQGSTVAARYLDNVTTGTYGPPWVSIWADPAVQKCVSTIKKAFPNDPIYNPNDVPVSDTSKNTYVAPGQACEYLAVFETIAKAAGRDLTDATFDAAGYSLRNVTFPGSGGPVSFGPNQPYALGPVWLVSVNPGPVSTVIAVSGSTPVLREDLQPLNG